MSSPAKEEKLRVGASRDHRSGWPGTYPDLQICHQHALLQLLHPLQDREVSLVGSLHH